MTFAEIEQVLGLKLPASKQYPAWWSNNPSNNPMTSEWLGAGYETESVNIASGKLVFRRMRRQTEMSQRQTGVAHPSSGERRPAAGFSEAQVKFTNELLANSKEDEFIVAPRGSDPLFGCMAGTLTLLPDVDYTAPADPDWGKVYDD